MILVFLAKLKSLPFYHNSNISKSYFDIVHMDIWDAIWTPSMFGYKYFLTTVDDHNKFCWIFLMKLKYEASPLIQSFIQYVKTHFDTTVTTIRYGNSPKFLMENFYQTNWIIHHTSCPVLTHPNRMGLHNVSTNTFLMLLVPYLISFTQYFLGSCPLSCCVYSLSITIQASKLYRFF